MVPIPAYNSSTDVTAAGGGKDRGELDPHGGEVQGLALMRSAVTDCNTAVQAGLKVPSLGALEIPWRFLGRILGKYKMLPAMRDCPWSSMVFLQSGGAGSKNCREQRVSPGVSKHLFRSD